MRSPLVSRTGLSIRARTIIGYSLISLLALSASVLSLVHIGSTERTIDAIVSGSERIRLLTEISLKWEQMMTTLDGILLTRQSSVAGSNIREAVDGFSEAMDRFQRSAADIGMEDELAELSGCADEAVVAVDSIGSAARHGLWARAQIIHHTDLASIQRRMDGHLERLHDEITLQVTGDIESAAGGRETLRNLLIAAVVLVIILGPLTAILTASSVIRPVEYLASSVRSLKPQGLQEKLEVSRNDEIGELANAYNSMTERLHQALRGLEDQVEAYREVQDALKKSEARYRNLFQHSPISLWELDLSEIRDLLETGGRDGREWFHENSERLLDGIDIIDVNRAGLELLEAGSIEDLRDFSEYVPAGSLRILLDALHCIASGCPSFFSEAELTTLKGETRHVAAHFACPPEDRGGKSRLFVSLQDITPRKIVESALRRSEEQYLHAQKMEAVGRLTGGIAHDFNNILTVIISNCEITLMDTELTPGLRSRFQQVLEAAGRAAAVTEQLLAFSHQQVTNPVPVDPNALVRGVSGMLEHVIGEDIRLEISLQENLPPIEIDPVHMEQVLLNLAVNARDAMPRGGTLSISTSMVPHVAQESEGGLPAGGSQGMVVVSVRDTGLGMTPEVLDKAFDPFFTTKEKGKGTGLGLASVQGIVTESGGFIEVDSTPEEGTEFRIHIPPAAGQPVDLSGPAETGGMETGRGTVLLVEDEMGVRDVVSNVLSLSGYRVLEASDSSAAMELFRADRDDIDLLVTDVVLPGSLDGIQVARRLLETKPDLSVLFMSGYIQEALARSGSMPPGSRFISKPFSTRDFLNTVGEMICSGRDRPGEDD
ncbi:MAG: hypothetical protein AVO35_09750 [Candidatus Aegiribacteria sp. MLS_C]|nr:MAG: hypothetical protein AVO35_09750 [Candidatus Aegiribacteria sp. MLS_C]